MARPRSVRIGPYTYRVEGGVEDGVHGQADETTYGQIDEMTHTISLRDGMGPDTQAETLLHEVLHAMFYQTPIPTMKGVTPEVQEAIIRSVSPILLDTLRRNRGLTNYLLG